MEKCVIKAISIINAEINVRNTKNIIDEFDDSSSTYSFIFNSTINNKLSEEKISEYSREQQKDYLYNILVFWIGISEEKAIKQLKIK